jgi:epoxyqueuosine reductase
MQNNAKDRIFAAARSAGFPLCGLAVVPEDGLAPHGASFSTWLAGNYHKPIAWIEKNAADRLNVKRRFPWAKSILCLGVPYNREPLSIRSGKNQNIVGRVARYARGRDYHLILAKRLKRLAAALLNSNLAIEARWFADAGPILERSWAALAGLGEIGKNGCLIHPQCGSYFVLAEILLDTEFPPTNCISRKIHNSNQGFGLCGDCRLCLDACPTQALVAPGFIDCKRCLSAYSFEAQGRFPTELHPLKRACLAGCDICQEICPQNREKTSFFRPDEEFLRRLPWENMTLEDISSMKKDVYDENFRGSSLRRMGLEGISGSAEMILKKHEI